MYTNSSHVYDIAKANYRTLVKYCTILEEEGYFAEAGKILHKSIFDLLDFYIQSLLITLTVFSGHYTEKERRLISSLPDSRQIELPNKGPIPDETVKQAESVVKAPPVILQLISLRDREKGSELSSSYIDTILNIIVAMSYLNDRHDEYLINFIMDFYHSIEAFVYYADREERFTERYLFKKASGDLSEPGTIPEKEKPKDTEIGTAPISTESSNDSDESEYDSYEDDPGSIPIEETDGEEGSEDVAALTVVKSAKAAAETPEERKEKLQELLCELEGLVGLEDVKKEVHSLVNLIHVRKLREEKGLPSNDMSYHMVFTGNPGTGKTTVARLIASIYKELGVLSKGQLVEVDRSGLVAGYVGQTALKVNDVVKSALGGVLFIDEAYSLIQPGNTNDFGQEAVDTLVKLMEDHRDDLVVIVAGYTKEMKEFLKSNTGLVSRFNKFIDFRDYTDEELVNIMQNMAEKMQIKLSEGTVTKISAYLSGMSEHDRFVFGNARGIRNLFEKMLVGQANRLATMEDVSVDDLSTVIESDFESVL